MKWIDELEKIKSPDPKPKPIGVDDPNSFLWGVKNHTDKTDRSAFVSFVSTRLRE